jgi:Cd2+/Zn2+-exporting ATPase
MHLNSKNESGLKNSISGDDGCAVCADEQNKSEDIRVFDRQKVSIIGIAILLYISGFVFRDKLQSTPFSFGEYLVFVAAYLLSGWRVLLKTGKNVSKGKIFDENFLMTVATVGALIIKELPEAAGVMIFYQLGDLLQEASVKRSRRSVKALLDIAPRTAHRKTKYGLENIPPEKIKVDDTLIVRPGEKIPLDGVVIEGSTQVDTSPLTGESVPEIAKKGDTVSAGTINNTGAITIRVTRLFKDSSISKIMYLVEKSAEKKARTEKFVTQFARYYTPFVVFSAMAVAVFPPLFLSDAAFSDWIYRALVLLVISCPCALMVSIPLGYFGGIGKASRSGILVKGANFLDVLTSVKTVIFDKTGTLTKGVFKVTEVRPENGFTEEELLQFAAEAEANSNHPIASSILSAYGKDVDLSVIQDYRESGGFGIEARIRNREISVGNERFLRMKNIHLEQNGPRGTVAHVAVDGLYAGYIIIADELKSTASSAIKELRKDGVKQIGMLTGDNFQSAETVSKQLGLDCTYADLLPESKVTTLEKIISQQGKKEKTVFVGDGINDAPVIARADVGIAMGNMGSDAAVESADVVLMTDSPLKVSQAIRVAKKTRMIVLQNILIALLIKGAFITLGIAGSATMWQAVFADVGVALLAVFNSMRILR